MNPETLIKDAQAAHDLARTKRSAVEESLLEALRQIIPSGMIINTRALGQQPDCVLTLKTVTGNDRGTSIFRVERICSVEVNLTHLSLSKWVCEAIPISEKTGKDMSASSGNSRHGTRNNVRLQGYVLLGCFDDFV
jgi:hypothetical protein